MTPATFVARWQSHSTLRALNKSAFCKCRFKSGLTGVSGHGLSKPLDSGLRRNDGRGRSRVFARNGGRVIRMATRLFFSSSSFRRRPESTPAGMQGVWRAQPSRGRATSGTGGRDKSCIRAALMESLIESEFPRHSVIVLLHSGLRRNYSEAGIKAIRLPLCVYRFVVIPACACLQQAGAGRNPVV